MTSSSHKKLQWVVSSLEEGMTLHAFLRKKYPDSPSVKALKRAIDAKCCTVNGKVETFATRSLRAGNRVELDCRGVESSPSSSSPLVLYEDEELLICNKPAGLISENRLLNTRFPKFKNRLQLVHRLDKETSGALILAKNDKIKEQMFALFAERQIHKVYLALVDGEVKQNAGIIDTFLKRRQETSSQVVVQIAEAGQRAITHWKCVARGRNASLLLCEPLTGRTHQLRVHLKSIGHPILGDLHYGKRFKSPLQPKRHLLHAYAVFFTHPTSHAEIRAVAPIPEDFKSACKELEFELKRIEMAHLIEFFHQ
jgi:23S rRNA pseudouridine955/2504/2580 synthase/23S rRNA pseudouridine1911/1915/1917 synthase